MKGLIKQVPGEPVIRKIRPSTKNSFPNSGHELLTKDVVSNGQVQILSGFGRRESIMVYQDKTKPAIETDLSKIKQLSHEHDDENWDFRSWLKQHAPDNIDGIVHGLSEKYFTLIDCKQCANCCRSLHAEFKKSELLHIATTLGQSIEAFEKQFMSEGEVNPPCPMLDGKLCSIYENRPEVCRTYPHLEKPRFVSRLMGVIDNVAVCPIAFNAFEELKTKLGWSQNLRQGRR